MPDFARTIAASLSVEPSQVQATIELLDEGATVPFIARYRKEATGTLDEEQLRQVQTLLEKGRALEERRTAVIASIEEQGKMTPELLEKFTAAETLTALEDLYAPYKPKRRTRATIAREKGLQGLADLILTQARTPADAAKDGAGFLNEQVTDGRRRPGRRARYRRRDHQRPCRGARLHPPQGHAVGHACRRKDRRRQGREGRLRGLLRVHLAGETACARTRCWPSTAARPRRCCA